jgi:putative ABC transport system permease protein
MFDLDHWQEIWDALRKNKLRTFLTAFGVFWGIFLLVLLLGSGNGLSNGVNAGFSGTATNSLFVWGQRSSKPYKGLAAGRAIEFSNEDTAALRRDVTEARLVAPRLQLGGFRGGNTVTRGGNTGAFSVMGDLPEIVQIQSLKVINGRFLDHIDLEEHRKVAVIGKRVQEILFDKGEDPIGGSIKINGVYFKVIGVFASRQSGNQAERDLQTIYTPFTTAPARRSTRTTRCTGTRSPRRTACPPRRPRSTRSPSCASATRWRRTTTAPSGTSTSKRSSARSRRSSEASAR